MRATAVTTATTAGSLIAYLEGNNSYPAIKKTLDFKKKWGCCKKSLSLLFMLTTGSRDWKNHSTQSRCKGVRWRKPSQTRGYRRLWVKQVVLSAQAGCLLQ